MTMSVPTNPDPVQDATVLPARSAPSDTAALADGAEAAERLASVMARMKRTLWGVAAISAVYNVLLLSGSLYMMLVYDVALVSASVPTLMGLFVLVTLALAAQGVVEWLRGRVLMRFASTVDYDLSPSAVAAMAHAARTTPGGDPTQPVRDLDTVRGFLGGAGPTAFVDLPWILFFVAFLFFLHPWLAATVLAGAAVLIALTLMTERTTQGAIAGVTRIGVARGRLTETVRRHADVLYVMGMEGRLRDRWSGVNRMLLATQDRVNGMTGALGGTTRTARQLLQSIVLTVGALLVMRGQATGGVIIASSILSARALAPIDIAIANLRGFVAARQAWDRLSGVLPALPRQAVGPRLPDPHRTLRVEKLSLIAPGQEQPFVRDVSFGLDAGQVLAIVGPSGSGKSSLARGLVGLWPAATGSVRLDGATLDQYPPAQRGACIGYLPQDVELIEGTIAENIARFDPTMDAERTVAAAQAAGVHALVTAFEKGYGTPVGPDGHALSGGQRQRIALARALYGKPFLIVMDEPNAHLDTEGEVQLIAAVKRAAAGGAIVVIIAHRPAVLEAADTLAVIEGGHLTRFGPRDEILRALRAPVAQGAAQP